MLALLLVLASLAVMTLASLVLGLLLGRAVRHGEQQARATRHAAPHAAYWGRDTRTAVPPRRGRHAAIHTPSWARTDRHGDHR
ncbi:hypothetical protein ACIRBY_23335 [Streptomyces sp. NPDC096136]|uniref:hypothetical protein n=1 Tax=Streptomyces sp. NPDC096136 TaxID=3366076 RepID=UPI0038297B89